MTKQAEAAVEKKEIEKKMVNIYLIKDTEKYKGDVFVCVNGKSYVIQRGKNVEVPEEVAEALKNSQEQDARAAEYMEQESEKFEKGLKLLI